MLFLQFQVNPTNVGRRCHDVDLYDGERSCDDPPRRHGLPLDGHRPPRSVVFVFLLLLSRASSAAASSRRCEPFDLILLVVLGDLVQQGVTQNDYSLTGLLLAIGDDRPDDRAVSYLGFRFRTLRPVLDGEPIVLVRTASRSTATCTASGSRSRSSRPRRGCRADRARSTRSQWAVLETNGQISFIKKQ